MALIPRSPANGESPQAHVWTSAEARQPCISSCGRGFYVETAASFELEEKLLKKSKNNFMISSIVQRIST